MSESLWPHGLYSPCKSPGQNTGVGSLPLFQGIFPTQGSNPGPPHCRWILYQLSLEGSPRILECVAVPFSSRSSQPRNRTRVSYIAGRFFTNWAMREVCWFELKSSYYIRNIISSSALTHLCTFPFGCITLHLLLTILVGGEAVFCPSERWKMLMFQA